MENPRFSTPLSGWDLATWRLGERDTSLRSTVIGIIELSGHPEISVIRKRAQLACDQHPILRCCVESLSEVPHLVELEKLNFEQLVSEHSGVSDLTEFAMQCADFDFEPNTPLWRLHIVRMAKRTFIIAALHHSIADGNGALQLAGDLFDESQMEAKPRVEFSTTYSQDQTSSSLKNAVQPFFERALKDPVGLLGDINSVVSSLSRLLQLPKSPGATSMTSRGSEFGVSFYQLDKSAVRSLIKGHGVTQHDALVAFALKALWNFHQSIALPLTSARINVPVAMNVEDAAANRMIVARLECDVDSANFDQLMVRSHEALRKWRDEPGLALAGQLVEASRLVPIDILTTAVKQADATISTLRGVPKLGHIDQHQAIAIWPLVAPVGAAISITSVGIGQSIFLCLTWDKQAIAQSDLWGRALQKTWDEIFPHQIRPHQFEG